MPQYWCPYCGEPQKDENLIKNWRYHSPRGGSYFVVRLYECHKCHRRVKVTEKEPGIPVEEISH